MKPTNKDSKIAGAHVFQAAQDPELDTLGSVAIRNFLKKQARYQWLVVRNNKADGMCATMITVMAARELHRYGKDRCRLGDDCTDESVMECLESTKERASSVTAKFVKAKVSAKMKFSMSETDPALRVVKSVADWYSLPRNLKLEFINGKPKKSVEHLASVIQPAIIKALIQSKLEMDKSGLKKDFLEFVASLERMAIIRGEHSHVIDHKQTGDSGTKNLAKTVKQAAEVLDTT
jgi:hypothetical protein